MFKNLFRKFFPSKKEGPFIYGLPSIHYLSEGQIVNGNEITSRKEGLGIGDGLQFAGRIYQIKSLRYIPESCVVEMFYAIVKECEICEKCKSYYIEYDSPGNWCRFCWAYWMSHNDPKTKEYKILSPKQEESLYEELLADIEQHYGPIRGEKLRR